MSIAQKFMRAKRKTSLIILLQKQAYVFKGELGIWETSMER